MCGPNLRSWWKTTWIRSLTYLTHHIWPWVKGFCLHSWSSSYGGYTSRALKMLKLSSRALFSPYPSQCGWVSCTGGLRGWPMHKRWSRIYQEIGLVSLPVIVRLLQLHPWIFFNPPCRSVVFWFVPFSLLEYWGQLWLSSSLLGQYRCQGRSGRAGSAHVPSPWPLQHSRIDTISRHLGCRLLMDPFFSLGSFWTPGMEI